MARSYQKNILRTFKGSRSRFVAIFAIVALGVGFLAGLLSTTPDMEDSMEKEKRIVPKKIHEGRSSLGQLDVNRQ